MADFTPINTQEEFDTAIGDRLKRERDTIEKKYADYEDLKKKAEGYDSLQQEKTQLEGKVKAYETSSVKMRIANESGLPYELAERLHGENEEEIRKDAETLSKYLKGKETAPLKETEPGGKGRDDKKEAIREMVRKMGGE